MERLEAGQRRPTASLLASFAIAVRRTIPPVPLDQAAELDVFCRLVAAAGVSLVEDTAGGIRRRERRLRDAGTLHQRHLRRIAEAERARKVGEWQDFRAATKLLARARSPREIYKALDVFSTAVGRVSR